MIFRRIRGHIVPIKQENKDIATGSTAIAAGIGIGVGGGKLWKTALVKANEGGIKAMDTLAKRFPGNPANKVLKSQATRTLQGSRIFAQGASAIHRIAPVAAAGLLAYGAGKVARGLSKEHKDRNQALAGASAATFGGTAFILGVSKRHGIMAAKSKVAPAVLTVLKATK